MRILSAALLFFAVGCKTTDSKNADLNSAPSNGIVSTRDFFDASRQGWTGRLIMPKPNERKPDGGVWFEVYDAPGGQTFSQPIWLTWNPSNPQMKDLFESTVTDINISASDLAHSRTSKDMVPERLNGLKRVSFLESLAGARTDEHAEPIRGQLTSDSMEVFIPKARLAGSTLLSDSEPVQIVGKSVMLLRFVQKSGELTYEAKKWQGSSFSSDSIQVRYQKPASDPMEVASQPTIEGIEKMGINIDGWYAFGDETNGSFEVRALEPRAAMMLGKSGVYPDGKHYINEDNFANTRAQKGRISTAAIQKSKQYEPPRGARGLLVHVFGGIDGRNGDTPIKIPLTGVKYYTGHFAFGVAEVMTDPFTGQPRLDLEYRQIYANNSQSITSGANKWHSYSGSLRRGWMYSRAISDAVIWHPALSRTYQINGQPFNPLEGLLQELSIMAARFRSGDGAGSAKVTDITSCAQDSNQAAFIGLIQFLNWTKDSDEVKRLIASRSSNPEGQMLSDLKDIAEEYQRDVIGFAGLRPNWRNAAEARKERLVVQRVPPNRGSVIAAIASRNFISPDWANKAVLNLFYKYGALEWFVRTNQVGGLKPNITPTAVGFD
jgi:predicted Abi (CAAX) family protease